MLAEVRQAFRSLKHDPLFALLAIAILALGIGANTAVFTVVQTVLLKPLPFEQPENLYVLREGFPQLVPGFFPFSAPDIADFSQRSRAFEATGAFVSESYDISGPCEAASVASVRASASIFPLLGLKPALGRLFTQDEDTRRVPVAVLSHSLWTSAFGRDPSILGRTLQVNRHPYTVIGVMPPELAFPPQGLDNGRRAAQLWVPLSLTPAELVGRGDNYAYRVIARVRTPVSAAEMEADTRRVSAEVRALYPAEFPSNVRLQIEIRPLHEAVAGSPRGMLLLFSAAVGCVLLIGCANIASLFLVRAVGRREEFAMRKALGANTWHLLRQALIESLGVAIPGSALGLLLAAWGCEVLLRLAPQSLPRLNELHVDALTAVFALALGVVSALLFSLLPALQASRTEPGALRASGKGATPSGASLRTGKLLVGVEVALCLVLLGGAGLMARTYWNLLHTSPGFRAEQLLTFQVTPRPGRYDDQAARALHERFTERLSGLPGVRELSYASSIPLENGWTRLFSIEGRGAMNASAPQRSANNVVAPNYFETLGIPVLQGRAFTPGDRAGSAPVVIVNETMARQFFPQGDAVGQRILWGVPEMKDAVWLTIVGVVGDSRSSRLDEEPGAQTFEPFVNDGMRSRYYIVRTDQDPTALASTVRAAMRDIDSEQVLADLRSMEEVVESRAAARRFQMLLFGLFAGVALVLAVTGIFSVVANMVTRQRREIGIRMALGASAWETMVLIMRRALTPVLGGVVAGWLGLLAIQQWLASFLYGVKANDVPTLLAVSLLLAGAAAMAVLLPARRALRVNPAAVLRGD